jgi:mono/diheme cytochrome c family protein
MKAMVAAIGCVVLGVAAQAASQGASDLRTEGPMLYKQYCATCHGLDAKGGGPTAPSLKVKPTDLTLLQKKGEPFEEIAVLRVINGSDVAGPHGTREMPVWGEVFRHIGGMPPSELAVRRLLDYVKSIQINKGTTH